MSSYNSLSSLLNTSDDMTVLRNNSGQDDGVDTVAGVDWFTFNGVTASSIYVSGNSFVGFGANNEHLKVCRRDGKMWYLYRQEGVIGATRFLKLRWEGYTVYNQTSTAYKLVWELFLFDDGGLYLNIVNVPSSSSYLGTSQLICGSNTLSYSVAISTPVAYSFLLGEDGVFTLSTDEYPVLVNHVPSGSAEFSTDVIQAVSNVKASYISWEADVPAGTTLNVYAKLSTGEYALCENGGVIPCLTAGLDLTAETLRFKVEMATEDPTLTPVLAGIHIQVYDRSDDYAVVLCFDAGNTKSIQRAVGDITIAYDGSGTLMGQGGPVLAFEQTFSPIGLDPKNNPHDGERISVDMSVDGNLLRIYYSNAYETERVSISDISVVGALLSIDDI